MKATPSDTQQHLAIAAKIIAEWGDNYSVKYETKGGVQTITFSSVTPINSVEPVQVQPTISPLDEAIASIRAKLGKTEPAKQEPTVEAQETPSEAPAPAKVASIRSKFIEKKAPAKKAPAKRQGKTKDETLSDSGIPSGTRLGGVYKGEAKLVEKNADGTYTLLDGTGRIAKTLSGAAKACCDDKPINGFRFFRLNWEGYKRADDLNRCTTPGHRETLAKVWDDFAPLEVLSDSELETRLAEIKAKKAAARAKKKAGKA